jgi:hypothetical protein
VRQAWGLGELPIKNMVHLLESKGVRVYSLAIDAVEVDAFVYQTVYRCESQAAREQLAQTFLLLE